MSVVAETLAKVGVKEPQTFRNLSVFPLIDATLNGPEYLTLDEAIAAGSVSITESLRGSISLIRLENRANRPILLVDGEELVGAMQNRILNLTILAPARTTIEIPVSCVEVGRWSSTSQSFAPVNRAVYARLRARKTERVTLNLKGSGCRDSDQDEIWNDIEMKMQRMRATSPTGAMAGLYDSFRAKLDEFDNELQTANDQVGAIFAIDDGIVGLELFDHPSTFKKLFPKLLGSYALDALDTPHRLFIIPCTTKGESFVSEVTNDTEIKTFSAIGDGTDIRLFGQAITGAALEASGSIVHLCAFRLVRANSTDWGLPTQQRISYGGVRG